MGTAIVSVTSRQVYTERGHPGVEATVVAENGGRGTAMCTAGISVGMHEVEFAYDGGKKWRGKGVMRAVNAVNAVIAPALIGVNVAKQNDVDQVMLDIGKDKVGGNATAAVSAAALKAGAASLGIPLYQHIGGAGAVTLPVPGVGFLAGGDRYNSGLPPANKPSHEFVCFGFPTFSEASYAAWDLHTEFVGLMRKRFGVSSDSMRGGAGTPIAAGQIKTDREIWDLAVQTIVKLGYEGKVGLQVDCAAASYYHRDRQIYQGLFEPGQLTRDGMIARYAEMVKNYPFVILEDPLDEDDYEGHAILTKCVGVQITGDDLFTTNPARVKEGVAAGAGNCVLLKVNQIGTISEAMDMITLAYRNGYGVQPCSSRGEGADIADYSVGINAGTVRGSAIGAAGNRFLAIEAELGKRAQFVGKAGFKGEKNG